MVDQSPPTRSPLDHLSSDFSRQVVLVTGAANGIGRATSLLFVERGAAAVALVDRDEGALDDVVGEVRARGGRALPILADLADLDLSAEVVDQVINEAGRLDIVVNNAATARQPIQTVDYRTEDFSEDLDVNLTAGFVLARDLARHLLEVGRSGSIVFVASINALGAGVGSAGYCASKAGVLGLMRVMAAELGEAGIRVNAVSPGPADTPRSTFRVGEERMGELRRRFEGAALRRLADPEDIAEGIVFLCSERADYITGHNLVIDGGLTATVYSTSSSNSIEEDTNAVD